jgi:nucleoid-associated protein YgaU
MYGMLPGGRWEISFSAGDPTTAIPIPQASYTCNDGAPVIGVLRTVVNGDTLWDIAQAEYGDPTRWPEIYAANADVVGADPDLIFPGQVLRIP